MFIDFDKLISEIHRCSVYDPSTFPPGLFIGTDSFRSNLDAACVKYLEARGYVCLKRHTEAPTEDLNGMFVVFRSIYSDRPDKAVSLRRGHQLSRDFQDFRSFGCEVYAIGPLPDGK